MELTVNPVDRLQGRFRVPGDKSISHRAAMLGAIANGPTTIHGFLRAGDCLSTLQCLRALGVTIEETPDGIVVHGSGPRLRAPAAPLDAGNSGTTMRLLAGILAGQPFVADLTGDASLRSRPMDRIIEPLARMGAQVHALGGERYPPLRIAGGKLRGITYTLPVASAQVKSAVLLAGLYAEGDTTVVEHVVTRDHTERMLEGFGCRIQRIGSRITVTPSTLSSRNVTVPGDISSAAFLLAAAAARQGSSITVDDAGINPTRTGFLDVLASMGAGTEISGRDDRSGEPIGTVTVRGLRLQGTRIGGSAASIVIDEIPVLTVIAAVADGETVITDAAELRVKESDRIKTLSVGLRVLGADVTERPDGMVIRGGRLRGGRVEAGGDHRIAMAFAVAGLLAQGPVTVSGAETIDVSFPGFVETLQAVAGSPAVAALGKRSG
ncbi:MAG: 3-phosphoshikimate 1-carboxyvinyltransferase [bacterium]